MILRHAHISWLSFQDQVSLLGAGRPHAEHFATFQMFLSLCCYFKGIFYFWPPFLSSKGVSLSLSFSPSPPHPLSHTHTHDASITVIIGKKLKAEKQSSQRQADLYRLIFPLAQSGLDVMRQASEKPQA